MAKKSAADSALEQKIENILHDKLAHFLEDISFRIEQAYDVAKRAEGVAGKIYAEDLRLKDKVFLTGYTVTPNNPAAGSFAWADLHVVYDGTDYPITNGSTANKFVWWSITTTPTVLQSGPTKPALGAGDVLLFVNNGGTPKVMLSDTNASMPSVLSDGAVDSTSIIANAVTNAAIADGAVKTNSLDANAVTNVKLADGAIARTAQLGTNVVGETAIAHNAVKSNQIDANAVGSAELANGAIARNNQMAVNVVTAVEIKDNTIVTNLISDGAIGRSAQMNANVVGTTQIAYNAVTQNQVGANAIGANELANGAVTRNNQIGVNVVTAVEIKDGAVTNNILANSAVSATKLAIARHILY